MTIAKEIFDGHVLFGMQASEAADLLASAVNTDILDIQGRIISSIHESFPPQFIPQFVYQSLFSELTQLATPIFSVLQLMANDASIAYPRFFPIRNRKSQEQAVADISRSNPKFFTEPDDPEQENEEDQQDRFFFFPLSISQVLLIFSLQLFANQTAATLWANMVASRSAYVRDRLNNILGLIASVQGIEARTALIQEIRRTIAGARGVEPYREAVGSSARSLVQSLTMAVLNQVTTQIARQSGIQKFVWSAILDDWTCLRCFNLNGKIFNATSDGIDGPQIPLHRLCRCLYIPEVQSIAGESSVPKRNIDLTFTEWFAQLPASRQLRILGKSRFELYQSGKLPLRSFLQFRGKVPVRIKQLNELTRAA